MAAREKTGLVAATHEPPSLSQDPPRHRQPRSRQQQQLAVARRVCAFLILIPATLLLLCFGAYHFGRECPHESVQGAPEGYLSLYPVNKHHIAEAHSSDSKSLVSNGTHWFYPTLIVVSLDGFRADYLDRGITPELLNIGRNGLRADYMIPSFPSSTFPNHYTIVTGLYPGSHGIVANEFYDSKLNDSFSYKDVQKNLDSKWWEGGEPIWVTAERQGLKTAINMWPGSTAVIHGFKPSYLVPYANDVPPAAKVDQLLQWMDLPLEARPSFLATYMPEVDSAAHKVGPDAKPVNDAIHLVDGALGDLWKNISQRNLTHIVNLMVVSDHGMAGTQPSRYSIYLDDIIDMNKLRGIYGWPLAGLEPKNSADVPSMYRKLKRASRGRPWSVYLRENIPERFHYTHQLRVAPIMVIPELPYVVTTRASERLHAKHLNPGDELPVIGAHGYDNLHPLMRATFVAAGPAFRSRDVKAPGLASTQFAAVSGSRNSSGQVSIQGFVDDVGSLKQVAKEHVVDNDGSRISDMGAMQDYLELLRGALVYPPDHVNHHSVDLWPTVQTSSLYRAEYDHLWGDSLLSESALQNIRHPPFENVELYAMMARILDVVPAPNNGTAGFSEWWLK